MDDLSTKNIHKLILDEALAGYWERNFKTDTAFLSPTFKQMFGYGDDEMFSSVASWEKIIYPEDLERLLENFQEHVNSRGAVPHRVEVRYKHKDGSTVWVLAVGLVIEWDEQFNPIRAVGGHIDISHQKKIEENLKISETQFKGAFENSSIGMALVSLDGHWLRVNKHVCSIVGYSEKELYNSTFQDITHPDDLNIDLSFLQELLAQKRESYQIEKRYFHKNGDTIWVQLNVSIVNDSQGNPLHFVSHIQDITKRKLAQRDLEALTKKLTLRNKKLGDFAHIASHNLRAPVSNLTTLVNMYHNVDSKDEEKVVFKNFEKVVSHLSSTLNDLIDSLKIQGDFDQVREPISFSEILTKTKEMMIGQIEGTNAQIESDFSSLPNIEYHRPYLESIFLNLLTNAIKYRLPDRNPKIIITSGIDNGKSFLKIADNGLGINLKRHGHKVFGLHKTFHRHKEAKGVGLFMTRAQVEAMGGNISVESEEGIGTTFTIVFKL